MENLLDIKIVREPDKNCIYLFYNEEILARYCENGIHVNMDDIAEHNGKEIVMNFFANWLKKNNEEVNKDEN